MSANNYILINKKTFTVQDCDADTEDCSLIDQGINLEQAIQIAQAYEKDLEKDGGMVEYGIRFI